jgi:DNA-binding response OmpR family regulator
MARILIIETNPTVQMSLRFYLEQAAHEVVMADDGESGIRMALSAPVDLILINVGLPNKGGLEICRTIKGDPFLRRVPVVMMTAGRTADTVYQAITAGALDVLSKPFDYDDLKAAVARYLSAGDGRR